jgi:SpoVK/Ycf46/Vps4 family AAA+-type ATPase
MANRRSTRARLRPVPVRHTLEDLALAGSDTTQLGEIAAAARRREAAGAVLFHGHSPTDRRAAAEALAAALDAPLYRIDLSQVVSRYIGETERRLAALFDEVAGSGAVLLFEEADALFGKRSQVGDAHDRHANVDLSYLLQRIDAHDGVSILAVDAQAAEAVPGRRVRWRVAIPAGAVRPPRPRG